MSHYVPSPPGYDVVMTEKVSGPKEPKLLGRHMPSVPYYINDLTSNQFLYLNLDVVSLIKDMLTVSICNTLVFTIFIKFRDISEPENKFIMISFFTCWI